MLVYHGSSNKFDAFSYDNMRTNGTSEGIGFYCTDNKTIAEGYAKESRNNGAYQGYLYTIEFKGIKHLSPDKLTITKAQLKRYLKALDVATLQSNNDGIDYLSNYDDTSYYGVEKVLKDAVELEYSSSDNDVDLIAGICNASGDFEIALTTFYKTLGYDSIIVNADWGVNDQGQNQTLYIALVNEAIEIKHVEQMN